jgi:L-ascorbate metabolism protein UlaG (beta-lactamase superfamily)
MRITQLRSATMIVQVGNFRVLVDPMLAGQGELPPLRFLDGIRQRNPTIELPSQADVALDSVTHCIITHCQKGHFDHLDRAGTRWLRKKQIPVICTPHDADHLRKRGLNVQPLAHGHEEPQAFLDGSIRTVRCTHGEGIAGLFMEHGVGYLIELPAEPSLYIAGDTILSTRVRSFVQRHQPDVAVVPAGGASFDIGTEVIMGIDDVIAFTRASRGKVVANHLEALSHCPVTRAGLALAAARANLTTRLLIPSNGETLEFTAVATAAKVD